MVSTVIVVGGPAGTGKSTIANMISEKLQCPFTEGDLLHPKSNVAKMAEGIPLTDEDRWDWLKEISTTSSKESKSSNNGYSVVSCSILKKVYRDLIKDTSKDTQFWFVFLNCDFDELIKRVESRQGHFMKSDMVRSQFAIMEVPKGEELIKNGGDSCEIDTTGKPSELILEEVINTLYLK